MGADFTPSGLPMVRRELRVVEYLADRMHLGTVITVDGDVIGCDAKFSALSGYELTELIGWTATRLVSPEHRDKAAENTGDQDGSAYMAGIATRDGRTVPVVVVPNHITYRNECARVAILLDTDPAREACGPMLTALMSSVHALSKAIESRDPYTAGHQERVGDISVLIAKEIGVGQEVLDHILLGALLHDIGKISIPAEVLVKPTKLNSWEWEMIKAHTQVGASIVAEIDCPQIVRSIVRSHHERLDGSGYPDQLNGDELAQEVRIVAVADSLDAITGVRPYHGRRTMEEAISMLEESDEQYDCKVVRAARSLLRSGRMKRFERDEIRTYRAD